MASTAIDKERPTGVTAIAVIFGFTALAGVVLAAFTAVGRLPLAAGTFLVGNGMETAGPGIFLVFAVLSGFTVIGLWRLAGWARLLGLAIAVFGMVESVPAISSAVVDLRLIGLVREGFGFIARGVIAWYLWRPETKAMFSS